MIEHLDGLPLALASAGTYLRGVVTTIEEYLHYWERAWYQLQEASPGLDSYDRTLHTTWDVSLQKIEAKNPSAASLLGLLAYFDNHGLDYGLLHAGAAFGPEWFVNIVSTQLNFDKMMRLLREHSLVEHNIDSRSYSMHNCVHAWLKARAGPIERKEKSKLAAICIAQSTELQWSDMPTEGVRLVPHARRVFSMAVVERWIDPEDEDISHALGCIGDLFRILGLLVEAEQSYEFALIGASDIELRLTIGQSLGHVKQGLTKFDEAYVLLNAALAAGCNLYGPKHKSTLFTTWCIGDVYLAQGKVLLAENVYSHLIEDLEQVDPNVDWLPFVLQSLGNIYGRQHRLADAEAMFKRALTACEHMHKEQSSPDMHFQRLRDVHRDERALGVVGVYQQDLAVSLSVNKAILCKETVSNDLGRIYYKKGDLLHAEQLLLQALSIAEQLYRYETPHTLEMVENLGIFYYTKDDMRKAEEMWRRALRGWEQVFIQEQREHTHRLAFRLRNLYRRCGETAKAEAMDRRFQQSGFAEREVERRRGRP